MHACIPCFIIEPGDLSRPFSLGLEIKNARYQEIELAFL